MFLENSIVGLLTVNSGRVSGFRDYVLSRKHCKLSLLLSIFAAAIFFSGCSGEIYRELSYGGSFLIDSLTVGFIRTENIERISSNAWDEDGGISMGHRTF